MRYKSTLSILSIYEGYSTWETGEAVGELKTLINPLSDICDQGVFYTWPDHVTGFLQQRHVATAEM